MTDKEHAPPQEEFGTGRMTRAEAMQAYLATLQARREDVIRLADTGDASGPECLALVYEHGVRIERDFGAAARWYRPSAEQGEGVGVAADLQQAVHGYRSTAEQGGAPGARLPGVLYLR